MTEPIVIRTSVIEADIAAVRDLVASTGYFNPEEIEVAVELIADRVAKGEQSDYRFLFLELAGRTVGYACYGHIAGTKESYDFYWLAVHADCQDRGYGRMLVARLDDEVRAAGGHRIYIETSSREQYLPTLRFHERNGYRVEARVEDFYAPGDSKLIMVKLV